MYWFLFPYFEQVWRDVGQMVDLYGNAEFFAEELMAFFLILENAEAEAHSLNSEWNVSFGYHGGMKIEKPAKKSDVVDCIERLKEMLNSAYDTEKKVVCSGD